MITKELLSILVCPENRTPLTLAAPALVDRLNDAIARGALVNKAGEVLKAPLEGALVRADDMLVYPIVDKVPLLLADEAILLAQLNSAPSGPHRT